MRDRLPSTVCCTRVYAHVLGKLYVHVELVDEKILIYRFTPKLGTAVSGAAVAEKSSECHPIDRKNNSNNSNNGNNNK